MSSGLLLVGGGGHCRSVLDSVLTAGVYRKIGIVDLPEKVGQMIFGVPILGHDGDFARLLCSGYSSAFVTLGSIGDVARRVQLFDELQEIGFHIPNVIDPSATVSSNVEMGKGIFVGKNAVINAGSIIGNGAIINTRAVVEHDCHVGHFVHLAPGSVLGGGVRVGNHTHVGMGAIVRQQSSIGRNCMVGMGSVVLGDIGDNTIAYGNPCKAVKER